VKNISHVDLEKFQTSFLHITDSDIDGLRSRGSTQIKVITNWKAGKFLSLARERGCSDLLTSFIALVYAICYKMFSEVCSIAGFHKI
jgi:hypothetical protein